MWASHLEGNIPGGEEQVGGHITIHNYTDIASELFVVVNTASYWPNLYKLACMHTWTLIVLDFK